ncbi:MAG TPA: NAD-dependent succinate-semialdehyde dehydrogenase [Nocardioides sp.]|uniref:NAD-dependent succinate-semialdehyde dehydrogenase n=1 Tax=uncultured Nocardioides sp. TaxID=198441 RepID=UPI000EC9CA98|nr:NAD-dependent succinate-semialdehyde dehydrogenase [uncultured Nocardioides sp.]HCB06234.1 succinate-semialdehyde dehydrogenase [Nocardioides sp.]HRD59604.1 NAD-dependent succinate-semialdehyde dehydrogenase [Nocardioides sp.]HRI97256.1 NAD-dependent succinate-semialdehyde dehydrogenase [Nocardioides sp.]HRK46776.1 NAD-dependent succinate-semialdehyde dehydrogenase [Nocardioides sp.]
MTASQPAYASTNPATGEVTATFDFTTDDAIGSALAAGASAFETWRQLPIEERAALTQKIGDLFAERADELARIAVEEMGKPLGEAVEEVEFCQAIFGYYAEHGPGLATDQPITTFGGDEAVVQKRPIGLLLGVMPWNFPYYQVARFTAPNLVLGNTMLLKHAESVPRCAEAIQRIFDDAGVPAGVFRNVFATFAQIETIIADPRVQGVSLTGSERAGSTIAAVAGQHLKKCVLELGGSDPYVVLDTDDVEAAATQAWGTRIYNTGQACNSNKRMIVMDDVYEPFVGKLVDLASGLRPGDPAEGADGTFAPLSSRLALERLKEVVDDAVAHGAQLHVGGEAADGPSAYYSPAVLTDVTPEMRAYREELFGPVAVVYKVSSDEEALRLANDTPYGLGGAVFSTDPDRAARVAAGLDVGMANVNTPAGEGAEVPFGGVKRSGFGRELGPLGMDEFVNKRLFYVKKS